MYAFRKPFTAATFEGAPVFGIAWKTVLIAAQVAGYTVSKFLGIRILSGMRPAMRALMIVGLIAVAELALLLFALTPAPWNALFLFCNGLPLGMVFGLVMGFLEGRRQTELLTAGLCASFIVASGFVKSVGRSLVVEHEVGEAWMPVTTGVLFAVPLLFFVWMLAHIPAPREEDIVQRSPRPAMSRGDRRAFFRAHALGIAGLVAIYLFLTIARSVRDDFAVEIWRDLGTSGEPAVFARVELVVAFVVLALNAFAIRIASNRVAFLASLGLSAAAFVLVTLVVVFREALGLGAFTFMTLTGLGIYIPYVAFHTTVFERLIAVFRQRANIAYLMYLADAFGYLGYVVVMVVRNLVAGEGAPYLGAFEGIMIVLSLLSLALTMLVARYFSASFGAGRSGRIAA